MQGKKETDKTNTLIDSLPSQVTDFISAIQILLIDNIKEIKSSVFLESFKTLCNINKSGFFLYKVKSTELLFSQELLDILNLQPNGQNLISNFLKLFTSIEEKELFFTQLKDYKLLGGGQQMDVNLLEGKEPKAIKTFQVNFQKLSDNQNYVIVVLKDITDLKRFEEVFAKEKELSEESNRVKTIFLNNISHEIRTPMNAIVGFTELLNIGEIPSDKKSEYLSIIKNKSKHLLSLIDDIAELAKFEVGEVSISLTETNLPKLLNELHQEFSKMIFKYNKQGLDLYLKLPLETGISTIYTDSGRIQQVMTYLLDNAIRYTEKGYIQFGYEQKDARHLQFFVKDTGVGIHKEAQKYLFNRYKIKEESYEKKYLNTGLGLTISRAIVETLGGKIHVDSTIGQGSTFYFTIPLFKTDKVVSNKTITEIQTTSNWRNKVILVAEDDDVNYRFLEAILADTQAQLIHVYDGKQAIELCHTIAKIDLILMDIRMPEKSGYEAIKEIKKWRKEIPIIAQTAYSHKADREKCMAAGCDDYIAKPIDIDVLMNKINKFFND